MALRQKATDLQESGPRPWIRGDQVEPFDYAIVGPLVEAIVERRCTRAELLVQGFPAAVVDDCLERIARAEYKRRQARRGSR